ncbi:MAG: hypothetical protein R3242_08705 [Akkermansiaceae bacterium]|nr:hypothetical protein [Akkermansiaceae bacterium]
MKRRFLLIAAALLLITLLTLVVIGWTQRQKLLFAASEWIEGRILEDDVAATPPTPDAASYEVLCKQLAQWREELASRHRKAGTTQAKAAIEDEARVVLEHMLPAMMRCWLGTQWDFNGTAAKPGEGKIACGYFVSTVLRDAGLDVNRYRLAQQASQNIIHTFLDPSDCTKMVGVSYQAFREALAEQPPGIYICGLDTHVAFIVNREDSFRFIHSSGAKPWRVVDESPDEAGVLERSNYRIIGNLTANGDFIRTWLAGKRVKVVRN